MKKLAPAHRHSVVAESMLDDDPRPLPWEDGAALLARVDTYWLATTRPNGRPHLASVLAVWTDGAMHFCTRESSRKGQNLARNAACVLSASSGGFDLALEGDAVRMSDQTALRRVASAYEEKYGWRVNVREGAFQDTEGAPTAGPPPYAVYAIMPTVAFAFGTGDETMSAATRWRFS